MADALQHQPLVTPAEVVLASAGAVGWVQASRRRAAPGSAAPGAVPGASAVPPPVARLPRDEAPAMPIIVQHHGDPVRPGEGLGGLLEIALGIPSRRRPGVHICRANASPSSRSARSPRGVAMNHWYQKLRACGRERTCCGSLLAYPTESITRCEAPPSRSPQALATARAPSHGRPAGDVAMPGCRRMPAHRKPEPPVARCAE